METTTPKPFVFVLMPFDAAFDDIYQLGIRAACNDAGGYCERVDEQIFHESILERVYNQIAKADLLVADMTGRNPNVFYEVGYAHALGRRVILLTQKSEDIPFDLKHYPHIVYGGKITELKQELEKRVRWALQNPQAINMPPQERVQFFINGIRLSGCPLIEIRVNRNVPLVNLIFEINNSIERTIETTAFQLGLITDKRIKLHATGDGRRGGEGFSAKTIALGDDLKLDVIENLFQILPGSWEKVSFTFHDPKLLFASGAELAFTIRLFSESGPVDYPFRVKATVQN